MAFDKSKRIYFDALCEQVKNNAVTTADYVGRTAHLLPYEKQVQEITRSLLADFILYQTLKKSNVYVIEEELAKQIAQSGIDNPKMSDFRQFQHIFLNFTKPIAAPEAWDDESLKIHAIQVSWNTKDEVVKMMEEASISIPLSSASENCTIGIWYKTSKDKLDQLQYSSKTLPLHKLKVMATNSTRSLIVTESVADNAEFDERSVLPIIYRFMAFLQSSNVQCKEVRRELTEDKRLPVGSRPKRKPVFVPIIKEIVITTKKSMQESLITDNNLKMQSIVRGHSTKTISCPHCKKENNVFEISNTCKHCNGQIDAQNPWKVEWQWTPEHIRGKVTVE